jgi:hypothetical protein
MSEQRKIRIKTPIDKSVGLLASNAEQSVQELYEMIRRLEARIEQLEQE